MEKQAEYKVREESDIEKSTKRVYNPISSDTVSKVNIVSLVDARVLVTGTVTKTQYEFAKAGTVVAVDVRDKDEMLNKKKGNACCGGQSGKAIFQLV